MITLIVIESFLSVQYYIIMFPSSQMWHHSVTYLSWHYTIITAIISLSWDI